MKRITILAVLISALISYNCEINEKHTQDDAVEEGTAFDGTLKVYTLNMWHEGNSITEGFESIANSILQTNADLVFLCETNNTNQTIFSNRIKNKLSSLGAQYYTFHSGKSSTILSKYPILSAGSSKNKSLTKCTIQLNDTQKLTAYGAHLDYTHYACYLPRGYDGITWKKLSSPILDVNQILAQNLNSKRDEAIDYFVEDAKLEREKGNLVVLAGDFNEPSHLDWTDATKDLFDHNGTIVPWNNSVKLQQEGYLDAYRVKYPNPVTHPGFTWTAFNTEVELSKLTWAPEADDRDRIDFIYYDNNDAIQLKDIIIVGPKASIIRGNGGFDPNSFDQFMTPNGKWPSDHKGVLATFEIN